MDKMKGEVLVTDAQMRSSVAAIRSLGGNGLNVTAGETTRFATGFFSKYCHKHFVYPSPSKYEEKFIHNVLKLVKNQEYDVIFPMTDDTLIPIIKNKKKISKYSEIPFSDFKIIEKALNKAKTIEIALENNISCPETYLITKIDDLPDFSFSKFPLLIKPVQSYGSRGVVVCNSLMELNEKSESIYQKFGPFLVQEYIPYKSEIGVYTLFNFDSEPRAVTVQRRIRSYPISGGPSTLRETINDPQLIEMAFKLLKSLEWQGIAMVEFRIDPRDGKPKLMEINPRFWGSLNLSILSGVDFPYLLYKMAVEGDIEQNLKYISGIKCRWILPGDILWFLTSPHKKNNLNKFLDFKTPDDIISIQDIGPTFGFFLATLRYLFDREMWNFVLKRG